MQANQSEFEMLKYYRLPSTTFPSINKLQFDHTLKLNSFIFVALFWIIDDNVIQVDLLVISMMIFYFPPFFIAFPKKWIPKVFLEFAMSWTQKSTNSITFGICHDNLFMAQELMFAIGKLKKNAHIPKSMWNAFQNML